MDENFDRLGIDELHVRVSDFYESDQYHAATLNQFIQFVNVLREWCKTDYNTVMYICTAPNPVDLFDVISQTNLKKRVVLFEAEKYIFSEMMFDAPFLIKSHQGDPFIDELYDSWIQQMVKYLAYNKIVFVPTKSSHLFVVWLKKMIPSPRLKIIVPLQGQTLDIYQHSILFSQMINYIPEGSQQYQFVIKIQDKLPLLFGIDETESQPENITVTNLEQMLQVKEAYDIVVDPICFRVGELTRLKNCL